MTLAPSPLPIPFPASPTLSILTPSPPSVLDLWADANVLCAPSTFPAPAPAPAAPAAPPTPSDFSLDFFSRPLSVQPLPRRPTPSLPPLSSLILPSPPALPDPAAGLFPQPSPSPATGLFPLPSPSPATGLFPQPSPSPATGLFPQPSPSPATGLFPQPSPSPATGLFPKPSPSPPTTHFPQPSPSPPTGLFPPPPTKHLAPPDIDVSRRDTKHRVFNACAFCGCAMHIRANTCKACHAPKPVHGVRKRRRPRGKKNMATACA